MSVKLFIKCKICNFESNNFRGFSNHINKIHKISSKDYYDKYLKKENEDVCLICKNKTTFFNLSHGYRTYCSTKCAMSDENTKNKIKETCLNKYGYESASQSNDVKSKMKETCLKLYNNTSSLQSDIVKEKRTKNYFEKHGIKSPSQSQSVKEKKKLTYLKHFGTESYSQSELCKKLRKEKTLNDLLTYIKNGKILDFTPFNVYYHCNLCKNNMYINYSTFSQRLRHYNVEPCIICNPLEKSYSNEEKDLLKYIKTIYNDTIIENDRIILNGKELDIYLPKLKLAFEYDGTYWHADSRFYNENDIIKDRIAKDIWITDNNKNNLCNELNINLIRIKEYDWITNNIEEKNKIKNIINEAINE